ncbi:hypothetical protein [Brucella oryzae]|uniref:DUF2946 domain-containing protein n=1 Tax=Brucella oryzae TaxID=335286 RepID=A0A2S7J296_9HYPH|nr:hypothetical protein [Brucella oryzae]MBR7652320.1 hypothetical protein [Brucella oryzae]PQA74377.1 hypothetical protein C3731_06205 [Brucella oryzae]
MYRVQYDVGLRNTARSHAVLRLPSRVLMTALSLLFLVSVQLCYAMAHDAPSVQVLSDFDANPPHHRGSAEVSSDIGKTAPMDHGVKTPNACIMMTCGCLFQIDTDLHSFVPAQEFGLPPLVAALSGKSPAGDLRPPISLQT